MIDDVKKIQKLRKKIKQKPKFKPKPKPKSKIFDEYFQECIKNKTIPPDTPSYFRKALERAIKEYDQGIIKEKSALDEFANKYVVKGEPGILPLDFFRSKSTYLKEFLRNHRNIKVRFVLVCLMEQEICDYKLGTIVQDKAYFHSDTHINLESTDVKKYLLRLFKPSLIRLVSIS